jgi:hypothetical protein
VILSLAETAFIAILSHSLLVKNYISLPRTPAHIGAKNVDPT